MTGLTNEFQRILDISIDLEVELGRQRIRIAKLLEMKPGAVLELETQAGSPLSVYANGTLIAQGEAVTVGDRYGVRITQIVSPPERLRRMGAAKEEGLG